MKIYAVADIHGLPDKLKLIKQTLTNTIIDVLVIAGDFSRYINPELIIKQLNNLPVPVLLVRGNADRIWTEKLIKKCSNISSLHLQKIAINQTCFTGIGGTIPVPFRSRIRFYEKHLLNMLSEIVNKESVMVAHPPPYGVLDRVFGKYHAGCKSLNRIIKTKQPRLFICGHIHEDPGFTTVGNTTIVNCSIGKSGAGALIHLHNNWKIDVTML